VRKRASTDNRAKFSPTLTRVGCATDAFDGDNNYQGSQNNGKHGY